MPEKPTELRCALVVGQIHANDQADGLSDGWFAGRFKGYIPGWSDDHAGKN